VWFTMKLDMGLYGLAWAESIVAGVEILILFFIMSRRIPGLFDIVFVHAVARMASATGFMAVATYISVRTFPFVDISYAATLIRFAFIAAMNLVIYIILCRMLGLSEVNPIIKKLKKILFSQP